MLDYPTIRTKLNTSLQLKKILAASEMRQYAVVESVSHFLLLVVSDKFSQHLYVFCISKVPYRFYFPDATIKGIYCSSMTIAQYNTK